MEPAAKVLTLAALGVGGYLGYTRWHLPEQRRRAALALARQYQLQHPGLSFEQSLQAIGTQACAATALGYGIPPTPETMFLCQFASGYAVNVAKGLPQLGLTAGKGVVSIAATTGKSVAHEVTGAVKDARNFFSNLFRA